MNRRQPDQRIGDQRPRTPPVFDRRTARQLMKEAAERLHVLVSDLKADFRDRQISGQQ